MVAPKRDPAMDNLRLSVIWKNFFMGLGGMALIVTSVLALIQTNRVVELDHRNDNIRKATECRFDINAETDEVNGNIDVTVARIVVAAVQEDDEMVQHLGELLSGQIEELEQANERRLDAVEVCRAQDGEGPEDPSSDGQAVRQEEG